MFNNEWWSKLILFIVLNDESVQSVSVSKYLGVHIDAGLKFDKHVNEVVKNITRKSYLHI